MDVETRDHRKISCPTFSDSPRDSTNKISMHLRLRNTNVRLPRLFFRFKPGVPATLARVSLKDKNCQANLLAFPCWSLQEEGKCSALQNVVDIFLDPQDILWVLDTGVINSLEQPERKCPPKVVALNIKTGKVRQSVSETHDAKGASCSLFLEIPEMKEMFSQNFL